MAVDLESFLSPVLEASAGLSQTRDPNTGEIAADDPVFLDCAKIAFSQICNLCNRTFLKDTFTEYYFHEEASIFLREGPVESVTTVTTPDGDLIVTEEYTVEGDRLIIGSVADSPDLYFNFDLYDNDLTQYKVKVTYTGGYTSANESIALLTGLAAQTLAVYNRKDTLGIIRAQGAGGAGQIHATDTYTPDEGGIVETCLYALSPLVYYGNAFRV